MPSTNRSGTLSGRYLRPAIYLVAVILINIVGITLFFRWDLTSNKAYSISEASREVVATLAEPLTINVFFTRDLPAPHNNTERYIHDLLNEYAVFGNRFFNYRFYDVSPDEGSLDAETRENQDLADAYGIRPVQIQAIDKDEVKFQKAYMGLVIIHGDMIERIPTITTTDGLEYKLTTTIQKLNNKISALAGLDENIKIDLFLSSSLAPVAPYMNLDQLMEIPEQLAETVKKLNGIHFGKLVFTHFDPSKDGSLTAMVEKHKVLTLNWPALDDGRVPAGKGSIGLVMSYKEKAVSIPLLQVIKLPLIGTHYEAVDMGNMEELISENMETLIDINESIGYLADHGTLPLAPGGPARGGQAPDSANNFRALTAQNYSIKSINLETEGIPDSLNALIIARPTSPFSDYELYQIDQFLMKGKNLGLFLSPFNEVIAGGQQNMFMGNQGPQYIPMDTGLEKLLSHYGVRMNTSLVMDENCYKQQLPQQFGGGEQALYFVPVIKSRNINKKLSFIKNIKGLIALEISPLTLDMERIKQSGISAHALFSSSTKSWEMRDRINLNPMLAPPPPPPDEQAQFKLAYLLSGEFPSYYDGKPQPEKPVQDAQAEDEETGGDQSSQKDPASASNPMPSKEAPSKEVLSKIEGTDAFIARGKPGKIFLMASPKMLSDNILDEEGRSPNAMLIMNILDTLNNRDQVAVMRSKQQRFNPLNDTRGGVRTLIKAFNIAGLPVVVVISGLLVWFRRHNRKNRIRMMFGK